MKIEGFYIYGHDILPSGTNVISGTIGNHAGNRISYEETKRWPLLPSWAGLPEDVEIFAVFYHCVCEMRKKYPFVTLYIIRAHPSGDEPSPSNFVDLPHDVLHQYANTRVRTRFDVLQDGDFHERNYDFEVYLFDAGTEDFSDFGGIVGELSRTHGAILLSTKRQNLKDTKELIESTTEEKELRDRLLTRFDIFFAPDNECDFTIATKDTAIIEAFLRNPKFSR